MESSDGLPVWLRLTTSNRVGDLLWVYEGLQLLGRGAGHGSGFGNQEQAKDRTALYRAEMDARTGRSWRNLQDVSRSAQLLYSSEQQWTILRRSTDFYRKGRFCGCRWIAFLGTK